MSTILEYQKQLARILRIDAAAFADFDARLTAASGKPGIIQALWEENEQRIASSLDALCVGRTAHAEEIFDALTSKIEADDVMLYEGIGLRGVTGKDAAAKVCDFVAHVTPPREGFFLKEDVARTLLRANPPRHILAALGYRTVDEMLKKEDLFEVFSALRFLEDTAWLNAVFFKQNEKLTPDSFERRTIQIRALDIKWAHAAEKFVA
ncbi:MAG: hypothetical protein HYS43_00115, partial [Candidatus Liptonbacteria bacterium]|nr:hypothetical protein [Candidatus Liptonbacteria bacterium]